MRILTLLIAWIIVKSGSLIQKSLIACFFLLKNLLLKIPDKVLTLKHELKVGRTKISSYTSRLIAKIPKIKLPKSYQFSKPTANQRPFIVVTLTVFAGFTVGSLIVFALYNSNIPTPDDLLNTKEPITTEIYDKNGTLLYRFYEVQNRSLVTLDKIPKNLVNATIATEDKNFYRHFGVDFLAVARAAKSNVTHNQKQGASTITQQLIKNTLLNPDRTVARKLKEMTLAVWTEIVFSKKEILQMYFNEVPYGGTAVGAAAAAQTYFQKDVSELTLAESAYLAGLTAAPSTYSPYGNSPELGKNRQKVVLRRMAEDGYILKDEAEKAYLENLSIKPPQQSIKAPHFVMFVKNALAEKYGEKQVLGGGLKVTTTLDLDLQEKVEKIVSDEVGKLSYLNVTNGAAMVTDAKTGHILAMVGSKDYFDQNGGNYNVALALRQPGSAIKPVTYATAFKLGFSPGNLLLDIPVSFKNSWETYTPVNYDSRFHGPVTIRTALGSSYNIPAVKMLAVVSIPEMLKTAKDLGITTLQNPQNYGLSLTLGGGEVRMLDMMAVYGTFSQNGKRYDPQPVLKVTDSAGKVLEENLHPEGKQVITQEVAFMINNILSDNKARSAAFGAHSLLVIPKHTVAAKTGTTDNKRDNWTFGFTPEYVIGTWVGNNNNKPMHPSLTSGVTGAAPIWHKITSLILQNKNDVAFSKPATISEGTVDGNKDLIVKGQNTKSIIGFEKKPREGKDDKEVLTFKDPFSTYIPEQNKSP